MDGWIDEWMDGWMDGRMDGRIDRWREEKDKLDSLAKKANDSFYKNDDCFSK